MKINNYYSNKTFTGKLIFQGKQWTPILEQAIKSNPVISNLLKSTDKDLLVTLKHRTATNEEIYQLGKEEDLYRIIFKFKKETKGLLRKILTIFKDKNINLTKQYHSEDTIVRTLAAYDNLTNIFTKNKIIL